MRKVAFNKYLKHSPGHRGRYEEVRKQKHTSVLGSSREPHDFSGVRYGGELRQVRDFDDQIVHGLMSHLEHFGFYSVRCKPLEGFKPRMTWPDVDLSKSTLGVENTLRRTRDEEGK